LTEEPRFDPGAAAVDRYAPEMPPAGAAPPPHVLVADDDEAMATLLGEGLADLGYAVTVRTNAAQIQPLLSDDSFDLLLTDLRMPEVDGLELLTLSKRVAPERPVIVMTAFGGVDSAVSSLRKGAYHYLLKPFKLVELDLFVKRALAERQLRRDARSLRRAFDSRYAIDNVVTESAAMREVRALTERVADADVSVLLLGETGTGKGLFARMLHASGARAEGHFVSVNCAALPEALLESELFGSVKGAFTGAVAGRPGLFVEADGGTLFLDEIGDMSPSMQAKLLDVLERRVVRAVGATREQRVDVRIVSATHRDLRKRVAEGLFREDLLYRIEGIALEIPPLRLRREDIPVLAARFLAEARAENPRSVVERFSADAMTRLMDYAWPGNVRELRHAVSRAVLLGQHVEATAADLTSTIKSAHQKAATIDFGDEVVPVRELQRRYAAWALERVGGKKMLACEKLGIDSKTLNKWLEREEGADS
jgi:two-component system, NtrC family, response regulator HydG